MSYDKVIEFTAAVRGYHYYRRFWKPEPSQKLNCFFKEDNPFDPFAIKVCEIGKTAAVGHLFLEKFLGQRSFLLIEVEDCQLL